MYSKVLVPLDMSERAEKILPHVEALGGIMMGGVILLHVIEPPAFVASAAASVRGPGSPPIAPQAYVELIEEARELAEGYLSRIRALLMTQEIDAETILETGSPSERIVHTAEQHDVDLIALTSHGRTGLSRVFFGSVAAAVLHRSEIPLLLVRSRDEQ